MFRRNFLASLPSFSILSFLGIKPKKKIIYNGKSKYYYDDNDNVYLIEEETDKCWYKNCLLHRDDGPAIEYASGTKYWYKNGAFYRREL